MSLLSIQRSRDAAYLHGLLDRLRPLVTSDQHTGKEFGVADFAAALDSDHLLFLEAGIDGERCGGFAVISEGTRQVVHTMLLPPARGSLAVKIGRAGLRWVWKNTDHAELYSYCFEDRPEVMLFARLCGFAHYETTDDGSTVNGRQVRTHLLKITRPQKED